MQTPAIRFLRNIAATLATLSGVALIGALWLRELDGVALMDAVAGSVYLFVGIGLYGSSRFTLFVATAVAAAGLAMVAGRPGNPDALLQLRMLVDLIIILCSAWVLWRLRNKHRH